MMIGFALILFTLSGSAQGGWTPDGGLTDSVTLPGTEGYPVSLAQKDKRALTLPSVLIPSAAIGYGFLAMHNGALKTLNHSTRSELQEDHPGFHTGVDNYLQYSPAAALVGLNIAGVHGAHEFKDELILYGLSSLLMYGSTKVVKTLTHEERPDHSGFDSYPSGHTANAFASAELLRREYGARYPWVGVAGYTAAVATGTLRVYNNRHWVSDVIAGAAFGFLSTRIIYAVNPWIERHVLHPRPEETRVTYTRLEWHYPVRAAQIK